MSFDASAARILDVNLNRAREAIRVMEDYARFVLDDPTLAEQAKRLRHDLAGVAKRHPLEGVVRARDILGDVGRHVGTEREYDRPSPPQVAVAAGKRLSEALRTIEEYGKVADAEIGRAIERLRYRGYELERQLAVRLHARLRFADVRLYVLITEALCSGDWLATAAAAIDGGADCVQLREKHLPDTELLDRAKRLANLCHERRVLCIINDRADVAVAAGADGVHLGQDDLPVAAARRLVGPDRLIGLSTHTDAQVAAAIELSPDYIAVGPMFDSPTKPQTHLAGPPTLASAGALTSLPLVAIGGIDAQNVADVIAAGGRRVCVCGAVIAQPDVAEAARRIRRQLAAAGA